MSAPEMGQRAAHGAGNASKRPLAYQQMPSPEKSTSNYRVSGGCADHP